MRWILIWGAAALTILSLSNCTNAINGFQAAGTTDLSSQNPSADAIARGQVLYSTDCVSCHGSLVSSTKIGVSAQAIRSAISTQSQMSKFYYLSSSDIAAIALVLNTPQATPTPVPSQLDARPIISNRYLLASRLQDLFVSTQSPDTNDTKIQTIITTIVLGHAEAFGGNCTRNDPGCVAKPCGLAGSSCPAQLQASQTADVVPVASTIRQGYMAQVCEQILSVDKAVQTLLTNAALSSTTAPTDASLKTLLTYMFPGTMIDTATTTALKTVMTAGASNSLTALDQWRFIIVPVCKSNAMILQ